MKREAMIERVRSRLGTRTAHTPPRARVSSVEAAAACGDEGVQQFMARLAAQGAEVAEAASAAALPQWIAGYLSANGYAADIAVGDDPRFSTLDWGSLARRDVSALRGGATGAALTHAFAGVAETGSLVLASGPDNPATLAFLAEVHVVAVARDRIFARYETALGALAAGGAMPRAITLVSGPSRTGDIGGRIVIGAHGPRRLAVVVYR